MVSRTDGDPPLLSLLSSLSPRVSVQKTSVCGFKTSPCVRFESTHGGFFCVPSRATHHTTHTTPQHTTPHGDRERKRQRQRQTETERDREIRQKQRETERQRKRDKTRQDKKREDETIKEKKREGERGETR